MELIQSNLSNLGYNHIVSEKHFDEGTLNLTFVDIITSLSSQLVSFCKLESYVNPVSNEEDTLGFLVEVGSLLKELCCPYKSLVKEQITERFITAHDKILLVLYLCTELESAKIQSFKRAKKKKLSMKIELNESETAKEHREILIFLRFSKPTETVTPQILFGEIEKKLKQLSYPSAPREKIGEFLFSAVLMEKQWFQLENLYKEMYQEYKTRRELLLTRLIVTIKSFLWADRLKVKTEEIMSIYNKIKSGISSKPSVKLSHVLSAKSDLAIIEKTNSASFRKNMKSFVHSVIIGIVPDRGGRPEEQQPPPEVPIWQKNGSSYKRGAKERNNQSSGIFYSGKNTSYSRDIGNSRNNYDYSIDITANKRIGYSRDENFNTHSSTNNHKRNISSRNGYKDSNNRCDSNSQPVYQSVNYCPQPYNSQFGFGGYMPAGDNFHLYGLADGMSQINVINQSRSSALRYGNRGRVGYDKSPNPSRGRSGGRTGRSR